MRFFRYLVDKFNLLRACAEENSRLTRENEILKEEIKTLKDDSLSLKEENELLRDGMKLLKKTTIVDSLTGVFNRHYFDTNIASFFSRQERNEKTLAIIYIDLDNFKTANDSYGHAMGDEILIRVSSIFRETIRECDVVIRLGGDEFIIIATNVENEETLRSLTNRLNQKISQMIIEDCNVKITLSIGVCIVKKDAEGRSLYTPEQATELADQAMYKSKKGGRNQTTFA